MVPRRPSFSARWSPLPRQHLLILPAAQRIGSISAAGWSRIVDADVITSSMAILLFRSRRAAAGILLRAFATLDDCQLAHFITPGR